MSNEGEKKKTLTCPPLPLKSKRNLRKKLRCTPLPWNNQKIKQFTWPLSTVKSNFRKLQAIKLKKTKNKK
jgi:hypothetical protein